MTIEKRALILTNNLAVVQTIGSIFTDLGYQSQQQSIFDIDDGKSVVRRVRSEKAIAVYIHQLCFVKNGQGHLTAEIMKELTDSRYFRGIILLGYGNNLFQQSGTLSDAEEIELQRNPHYASCRMPKEDLNEIKAQIQGLEQHLR